METRSSNSDGFEYLSVSTQGFNPPLEVVETGESYILVAYVPGFRKEDIKVEITDNVECLKISGQKVLRELIMMRWTWHRLERSVGRGFSRAFRIPHNVNVNAITAKFHDYVLYVVMPKLTPRIQCEESLQNSQGVEDQPSPLIDTTSCAQDQLPTSTDQQDEVQPVFQKACSPSTSDEENRSNYCPKDSHYRDLPSEADVDEKMEAQDAFPISYESSKIEMEEEEDGIKRKIASDGLKSGFESSRIFSRRATVLLSIGVASLAIFAAHKIISRRK